MIIIQLLDEAEQNIVIYQWGADQLFADAKGRARPFSPAMQISNYCH